MARALSTSNTGIGNFDSIERAYTSEDSRFGLFLQQNGPLGRRFVLNTRLAVFGNDSTTRSAVEAPTHHRQRRVHDRRRAAQRRNARAQLLVQLGSSITCAAFTRFAPASRSQARAIRDGFRQQLSRHLRLRGSGCLRGAPAAQLHAAASAIRNVSYTNVQGGVYIQDDIKIRKGLTVTGGVRYEAQTHVPDKLNFAPRAGVTWAPFKSGKTTLRGSWGMFYDWLSTATYAQTLQLDGFRQRELNVINPAYPGSGRGRHDAADQPISAGRGPPDGVFAAAQRRHRADDSAPDQHQRSLQLRVSLLAARRPQPEHPGEMASGRTPSSPTSSLRHRTARARSTTINASVNINLAPLGPQGGPPGAAAERS